MAKKNNSQKKNRKKTRFRGEASLRKQLREHDKKQLYKVQHKKLEKSLELVKIRLPLRFESATYILRVSHT